MLRVYRTLTNQRIEFPKPTGRRARFFARFEALFRVPSTTTATLKLLAYSPENPILSWDFAPHRGPILDATLRDPLYQVMNDMMERRRLAEKGVDLAVLARGFSVPLKVAAERIGTSEQTLRTAVTSLRIPAWLKGKRYFLKPATVRAFKLDTRGRKRADAPTRAKPGRASAETKRVAPAVSPLRRKRARGA